MALSAIAELFAIVCTLQEHILNLEFVFFGFWSVALRLQRPGALLSAGSDALRLQVALEPTTLCIELHHWAFLAARSVRGVAPLL